ncbi:hypothetical protein [Nocardia altamirensis]|uniref:hypothetical protein n=1 Tax=Nocardia altamirensis TaxID=472158 RepID=UPI0008405EF8|nr:hypothetical protein [Nocardia altamirensis]
MSPNELPHDPAELLGELDSIRREQEALKQRMVSLKARYQALAPHADRFDRYPAPVGEEHQFGSVNIEGTVDRLDSVIRLDVSSVESWLDLARETAVRIHEYPEQPRIARQVARDEQICDRGSIQFSAPGDSASVRGRAPVPVSSEFARTRTRELARLSGGQSALANYRRASSLADESKRSAERDGAER